MKQVLYIPPDALEAHYKTLGRRVSISRGSFEVAAPCGITDLDWNHMDGEHRPFTHKTYLNCVRIASGPDFQITLTKFKFFGVPFWIQVSDIRLEAGLFYQCYSLLSLIQVHATIRNTPGKMCFENIVVSHPALRFVHSVINRRLRRLNEIQNKEDEHIRARRAQLRAKGYSFGPDERNFVTANAKSNQLRFPKLLGSHAIDVAALKQGEMTPIQVDTLDLLVKRDGSSILVWTEACPHEGGPLSKAALCENGEALRCRWHGTKFKGVRLDSKNLTGEFFGISLSLNHSLNTLVVTSI